MLKHNYHSHTTFCKHAKLTPEEVVQKAIEKGLETIGFSEHIHLEHYVGRYRLTDHQTALNYIEEVNRLKEVYKDKIRVLCGFESEGIHPYQHYRLTEWIRYVKNLPGVDFIILGHHNYKDGGHIFEVTPTWDVMEDYLDSLEEVLKDGNIACIAHPDGFYEGCSWSEDKLEIISERLIEISKKYDVPLGINVNGLYSDRKYPNKHFWELVKKHNAKAIIELDAHGLGVWEEETYEKAVNFAKEIDLETIDKLNI